MQLPETLFNAVDWLSLDAVCYPGERGTATWRTVEIGDLRVRMVDYSPGYLADHWCERGHVVLVVEGSIISELKDGSLTRLSANMGYIVSDGPRSAHRSSTETGARLFIVD